MRQEKTTVIQQAKEEMNRLGKQKAPFLFIIDYDLEQPIIKPLPLNDKDIFFEIEDFKKSGKPISLPAQPLLKGQNPTIQRYEKAFQKVKKHLFNGDSFLINLTLPSKIDTNFSLLQLFYMAKAKYKLFYKNKFVVFSPETFIKIKEGKIYSYPMKGTIDAELPDAASLLLQNKKEKAEHLTMVDLIRNDLSRFAKEVKVEKLCYLDLIKTHKASLWQMSSEISGLLPRKFNEKIGDIVFSLLPAGSISGAPKEKTLQVISKAENYKRGYYTGVFGYFDGEKMDSAVMIRFVEDINGQLYYKSGGGITAKSDLKSEYKELIQKIYVPTA